MDTFERTLEHNLSELAAETDDTGNERVAIQVRSTLSRRKTRRRGAAAFVAVAAAVAVAVAVAAVDLTGGEGNHSADTAGPAGSSHHGSDPSIGPLNTPKVDTGDDIVTSEIGEPCRGAKHAKSLRGLDTKTPVWTPTPGAVPGTKLRDAWTCYGTPVAMFGPIEVSYGTDWGNTPGRIHVRQMADQWGGKIETILGRDAWVAPGAKHQNRHVIVDGPGRTEVEIEGTSHEVMVVVNGVAIDALAPGRIPLDKVVRLVDSIQLPAALRR